MTTPVSPPETAIRPPTGDRTLLRINAAMIADAHSAHAPGSLILEPDQGTWRVHAVGLPESIDAMNLPSSTGVHDFPDQVIIPPLINAHTHLDLTHIGPQPHDPAGGFVPWLDMIRANRLLDDQHIEDSVNLGIQKSLAGGVIAVGDIAGAPNAILKDIPIKALAQSPMLGTSFLEFFGIGSTAQSNIHRLEDYLSQHLAPLQQELQSTGVIFGLSPHATNTISIAVYHWAAKAALKHNIPLCTHLAETFEEREFISKGTGTQRGFLERFGIWDDSILDEIGNDQHPIEHLHPVLKQLPMLCAHVNDAPEAMIDLLQATETSVAYCPRAHTYFGHYDHMGPHPFLTMLDAGINVTLGTDSIVNLDTADRISTLDDMRLLATRDQASRETLLKLTTINPAHALGLNPEAFTLTHDAHPVGLLILQTNADLGSDVQDHWSSVMQTSAAPKWLMFEPKNAIKLGG